MPSTGRTNRIDRGRLALAALLALAWIALVAVAPAVAAGPVTIRFQDWRLAEEPAGPSLMRMLEGFAKANPDVKVEPEPVSVRDKVQKFVTQARGGNPPDVVRVLTTDVPSFQAMGALADLEGFVGKAGGQAYKDQYSAFLINAATFGGKLYCMPNEGDAFVLYINARLWREAGLDPDKPPVTFADLEKANRALAKPGSGRYAFGMLAEPAIAAIWMQSWFTAHGADFFNPAYTDTLIDSPRGIEAFKFYTGMYTRDKAVPPGPTEIDYAAQVNLFAQEKVAYIQGPFATKGGILAANPQLASVLRAIPFPGTRATAGRGTVYCLTKASKSPEAAWKLIEWLNAEENQLRFFREATMMPTRKSALGKINVDADPIARVMIREAIPAAKSYPVFVGWPKAKTVLDDALASTLLGRQDPETAMKNAAREIRAILGAK
jgi:ABC-type glycerol-3-phosphate transport system substrate-binding protein